MATPGNMQFRHATREEIAASEAAGETLPLLKLGLAMEGCATESEMNANFFSTLERGYTPINGYLGKYEGACSLIGSGPSIAWSYEGITGDAIAINGAIKFLLDKGIVPKFGMIWDADPICEKFAIPHPGITYLIASRCHPKVFDKLKDCKVVVWHAAGDNNIVELMNRPEVIAKQPCEEPLINGGTAGITRGIFIASSLGYNEINIYGADSSYSDEGQTHVNGSLVHEKDTIVSIGNNPPFYFRTTPEWCAQVMEYKAIYAIYVAAYGIKLNVHGDGMLKKMHEILKAQLEMMGRDKFLVMVNEQENERQAMNASASEKHEEMKKGAIVPKPNYLGETNACQ